MVLARRIIYLTALGLLIAALLNVFVFPAIDWYREAIVQAVIIAAVEVGVLAAFLELIARFVEWRRSRIYLLIFAAPPMLLTAIYVFRCAWFGRDVAQYDTWHLVAMFVIVGFVWAVFAALACAGLVGLGFTISDYRSRNATTK